MRSCQTIFLIIVALSLVIWFGWRPAEQYLNRFMTWWEGEPDIVPEESTAVQLLPDPLLPPVYPARTRSVNRIIRTSNNIDIRYDGGPLGFDFNQVVGEYIDRMYYDTQVILSPDTIFSRDALLAEVVNLENSRERQFYMWNKFDLTIDHDIRPDSVLRVYVHLAGIYREQFSPDWSRRESKETELRMTNVLKEDTEHLLISLENKLRRELGTLIGW